MSTWVPSKPARERMLLYGTGGSGKSEAVLSVAAKVAPNTVYVIDTDYAWDVLIADYEGDNIEVTYVELDDWEGILGAIAAVKETAGADDWLVIDSVTPTWQAAQDWYTTQVYGMDQADYFMKVRKDDTDAKNVAAYGQITDWNVINKQYARLIKLILGFQGHVLLTAESKVVGENDSEDVKSVFGKYGTKPAGNKRLIHVPRTVIKMSKPGVGEWSMTTRKDRKREEMEDVEVPEHGGFAHAYLRKIAKWGPE